MGGRFANCLVSCGPAILFAWLTLKKTIVPKGNGIGGCFLKLNLDYLGELRETNLEVY